MDDKKIIINKLIQISNFIDYLKTSPLFSNTMINIMVHSIDEAIDLLKEQEEKIKSLEQTIEDICCG